VRAIGEICHLRSYIVIPTSDVCPPNRQLEYSPSQTGTKTRQITRVLVYSILRFRIIHPTSCPTSTTCYCSLSSFLPNHIDSHDPVTWTYSDSYYHNDRSLRFMICLAVSVDLNGCRGLPRWLSQTLPTSSCDGSWLTLTTVGEQAQV